MRQYLTTIKAYGKCPNYLRTDEGREIYMIADAHSNSIAVNGAPLTLEFQKIFLRQAVPPQEHDFTFTAQDLSEFATDFWGGVD
jgi:hypothetical protein